MIDNELVVTDDNGLDLTPIRNLEFAVIKEEQMNEIADFIGNIHPKMLDNFSKAQSNYMDTMLVFSSNTDVRNLRQISAEIERKKTSLVDTQFNLRKEEVKLKKKIIEYESLIDPLDKELCEIEIQEMMNKRDGTKSYIEAALKTILCMKQQFETIMKNKGIKNITELDFEKEEEEYHIKKSCQQAFEDIVATGRISVGNNRYLLQIGIMPNLVHDAWIRFLGTKDSYDKQCFMDALNALYDQLKGCAIKEANRRGINKLFYENSVVK